MRPARLAFALLGLMPLGAQAPKPAKTLSCQEVIRKGDEAAKRVFTFKDGKVSGVKGGLEGAQTAKIMEARMDMERARICKDARAVLAAKSLPTPVYLTEVAACGKGPTDPAKVVGQFFKPSTESGGEADQKPLRASLLELLALDPAAADAATVEAACGKADAETVSKAAETILLFGEIKGLKPSELTATAPCGRLFRQVFRLDAAGKVTGLRKDLGTLGSISATRMNIQFQGLAGQVATLRRTLGQDRIPEDFFKILEARTQALLQYNVLAGSLAPVIQRKMSQDPKQGAAYHDKVRNALWYVGLTLDTVNQAKEPRDYSILTKMDLERSGTAVKELAGLL